ncbi:MAG: signal peptidase I [Bacilli bacterium]|nr:signal peptidase I [Bacilli bacterium]
MKIVKEVMSYVIIIAVVLLIKFFIISPIRVSGDSMKPTLHNGEFMLLNEIGYRLNGADRFDIVVINTKDDIIIKRIIGLPGENIKYQDNKLYINGEEVEEPFDHEITHNYDISELNVEVVPEDHYFVLGDNRGNSSDSRIIGFISKDQIRGKVFNKVLFPFSKIRTVK